MVLQLTFNDFLRLRGAQGAAIEVLDGKVWITEHGKPHDSFLEPGRSYRVSGQGLVVVGAEAKVSFARVEVRRPARRFVDWVLFPLRKIAEKIREERTRRTLHGLSDRTLRDIGLQRDEINRRF